jgi:type IV secretory pathway VirB3-like protein
MLVLVLSTFGVLVWLGSDQTRYPDLRASVALPLLLLLGLGSLLLLLALLVAVLNGFGLTDKRHAFGLPDGSMQAIIALALILIFIISSLFLYSALPDVINAGNEAAAQNKQELAQQLLTTVGTLAVAVAGFYFGTRSVEAAAAAVGTEAVGLRIVWPSSPAYLDLAAGTTLEPIVVETDPDDRRINVDVTGDDKTSVEETQPGIFQYKRGASAAARVVLTFSLLDGSAKSVLEILDKATKLTP